MGKKLPCDCTDQPVETLSIMATCSDVDKAFVNSISVSMISLCNRQAMT